MSNAKVAIILPSFNRPTLVQKAIESIQAQTLEVWKLYIMDNSSPNLWSRMREIYARYTKNDPRIKVDHTHVENSERYSKPWLKIVYNKAVFKLLNKEPYVQLSADDDYMMPNKLEVLSGYLDRYPEISVVAGIMHVVDENGNVWSIGPGRGHRTGRGVMDWMQPMFRREVLIKAGPLLEDRGVHWLHGSDLELWDKAAKFHNGVHGIDIVLDRQPSWTKGQEWHEEWRQRGRRGEVME